MKNTSPSHPPSETVLFISGPSRPCPHYPWPEKGKLETSQQTHTIGIEKYTPENWHDNGKTTHLIWRIEEIPTKIMISHCHLSFFGGVFNVHIGRWIWMPFAWLSFSAFIKKALSFKDLRGLNMKLMEYAGVYTVINICKYVYQCNSCMIK